jgi:hypothetical protein
MAGLYVTGLPNAVDAAVGVAAQLADGITPPVAACREVLIRADAANTADILLGDVNNQTWPLHKDEVVSVKTTDITVIYRKAASGTQKLYWWARSIAQDL